MPTHLHQLVRVAPFKGPVEGSEHFYKQAGTLNGANQAQEIRNQKVVIGCLAETGELIVYKVAMVSRM